jgi:hypothetical protein
LSSQAPADASAKPAWAKEVDHGWQSPSHPKKCAAG